MNFFYKESKLRKNIFFCFWWKGLGGGGGRAARVSEYF